MDPVFLDALASKFNVITFDYSGIGLSTGPRAADTLSMAKDVKDVAEGLKLTKVIMLLFILLFYQLLIHLFLR
jgi:pimeloyl-ACP methyl ester carboxylesterase